MTDWGKMHDVIIEPGLKARRWASKPIYETELGAAFCGDSLEVLRSERVQRHKGKVGDSVEYRWPARGRLQGHGSATSNLSGIGQNSGEKHEVVDQVAARQPPRLLQQAVDPLAAQIAHPRRGTLHLAGLEIEQRPDAEQKS